MQDVHGNLQDYQTSMYVAAFVMLGHRKLTMLWNRGTLERNLTLPRAGLHTVTAYLESPRLGVLTSVAPLRLKIGAGAPDILRTQVSLHKCCTVVPQTLHCCGCRLICCAVAPP